jgi:hypothetical protein
LLASRLVNRIALAVLFCASFATSAQDVLSLGSGSTAVPVTIGRNTPGSVQAVTFKVLFDEEMVDSVSFARAGEAAVENPLYETSLQGVGFFSYAVLFAEPLDLSGTIGTLTVAPQPSAAPGTEVPLLLHPPSALLSDQTGVATKSVANGALFVVNGSIVVPGAIAAPSGVVAASTGTSSVTVEWNAVAGADQYEIWRSSGDAAFVKVGTTTSLTFANAGLSSGTTYLYRLKAVNASGHSSPFSTLDWATTTVFADDPLTVRATTVKALHVTQLRSAVNAFRVAAGLTPLAADPEVAVGTVVGRQHVSALRNGLNDARVALGFTPLAFTDQEPITIRAVHLGELRDALR